MTRSVTEMLLESLSNDPFTPCVGLVSIMMVLLHDCLSLRGFVAKPFAQFESSLVEHLGWPCRELSVMVGSPLSVNELVNSLHRVTDRLGIGAELVIPYL